MKTTLTIGGAIALAIGTLLARATDLVTDAQLTSAAIVIGFTVLSWIWGAGLTEFIKRWRVPRPWTVASALEMFAEEYGHEAPRDPKELRQRKSLLAQAEKSRRWIYFHACVNGGVTLAFLIAGHFTPDTLIGRSLTLIYGLGVGGLALPTVYTVVMRDLWPWLTRRGNAAPSA